MSDTSVLTTIIAEPIAQLGIFGAFFVYVIYSDWVARKERTKIEAVRAAKDAKREDDCVKRIQTIEDRQMRFVQTVTMRTNAVLEDLTNELRRHGFHMKTPLPELPDITEEETTTIHRTIKQH